MGWAIRRADGTYRAWIAAAQTNNPLELGETWEELSTMPTVGRSVADEAVATQAATRRATLADRIDRAGSVAELRALLKEALGL